MFTAVVWIGQYGSWSKGGFASYDDAAAAGADQIYRHAFGGRTDRARRGPRKKTDSLGRVSVLQ